MIGGNGDGSGRYLSVTVHYVWRTRTTIQGDGDDMLLDGARSSIIPLQILLQHTALRSFDNAFLKTVSLAPYCWGIRKYQCTYGCSFVQQCTVERGRKVGDVVVYSCQVVE